MGYEAERAALYAVYQDVVSRIALMSVRDLAETALSNYPDAATVVLDDSDQSNCLMITGLLDAAAHSIDVGWDGLDWSDWGSSVLAHIDMETAGNLSDDAGKDAWGKYVIQRGRNGAYYLDIARALTIDPADFAPMCDSSVQTSVPTADGGPGPLS